LRDHQGKFHLSERKSFSSQEKADIVLRALRGEAHDALARDCGAAPDRIARWQSRFIEGGTAALSRRRHRRGRVANLLTAVLWIVVVVALGAAALVLIRALG